MLPESTGNSSSATSTTTTRNFNLSLNLNGSSHGSQSGGGASARINNNGDVIDETTKLLASERDSDMDGVGALISQEQPLLDSSQREDSFGSDASSRKIKMSKLSTTTTKSVALKR